MYLNYTLSASRLRTSISKLFSLCLLSPSMILLPYPLSFILERPSVNSVQLQIGMLPIFLLEYFGESHGPGILCLHRSTTPPLLIINGILALLIW